MTSDAGMHPRHEWVALAVEGEFTETLYGLATVRTGGRRYSVTVSPEDVVTFEGDDGALYLVEFDVKVTAARKTSAGEVRPFSSASLPTPVETGIDTCRHRDSAGGVAPGEITGSGPLPGD